MAKIVTIVGARPQFIKAAVVSRAFSRLFPDLQELLIHTGQHYDANMSSVFFDELDIPDPRYNLGVGGGTHGQNTGRMIEKVERVLLQERPDWVLVYGDTDSTLAGALAAVKLHIPVAHVEAGLRSFNRGMPEEINRVLVDHVAHLLFTPTIQATENLRCEGIAGDRVVQVGDVMYDAMLHYGANKSHLNAVLDTLSLRRSGYILVTVHRQENTDNRQRLCQLLSGLSVARLPVIWPLHPRTRARLAEFGIDMPPNVQVIDPVGYLDMLALEQQAAMIATDSGGVQKEAYFHRIPCLILRDETEWIELVETGASYLVGASETAIAERVSGDHQFTGEGGLYGDGHAGVSIAMTIMGWMH